MLIAFPKKQILLFLLQGCESNKNVFYIYGNWVDRDNYKIPFYWEFPLLILNGENSIAQRSV